MFIHLPEFCMVKKIMQIALHYQNHAYLLMYACSSMRTANNQWIKLQFKGRCLNCISYKHQLWTYQVDKFTVSCLIKSEFIIFHWMNNMSKAIFSFSSDWFCSPVKISHIIMASFLFMYNYLKTVSFFFFWIRRGWKSQGV